MKLYDYFRSSSAYRVRIALNLKGIPYDQIPINLRNGEQRSDMYLGINPQGAVPSLVLSDEHVLTQSLSIIEYLEETQPEPALLPRSPLARARVRALADLIAMEIHPVNNLRVLKYLTTVVGINDNQKMTWYHHWLAEGFRAFEKFLDHPDTGIFCHNDKPTIADICLIPQVYNAVRYEFSLAPFERIRKIVEACEKHPAFVKAHPSNQADAE